MCYVILSRIVNITQLFLKPFDQKKIYCNEAAKTEVTRIKKESLTKIKTKWDTSESIKIASLNIRSLKKHSEDLENDAYLNKSDIICISETWLNENLIGKFSNFPYQFFKNEGSEGVALLSKMKANDVQMINNRLFSMVIASYDKFVLINVYRFSKNRGYKEFTKQFLENIQKYMEQSIIICGDFNLDHISESNNVFTTTVKSLGFNYLVTKSTHILGGCIDNVYFRCKNENISVEFNKLHPLYFSDHDAVCFFVNTKES